MKFDYNKNLKIEFRAVPYSKSHVLEYRISPNQDLRYYKEYNWFWGLIKFGVVKKYSTVWHQPKIITNYPGSEHYSKESGEIYLPFFIRNKNDLKKYQTTFDTIGEFLDFMNRQEIIAEKKWQITRNEYLKNNGVWE